MKQPSTYSAWQLPSLCQQIGKKYWVRTLVRSVTHTNLQRHVTRQMILNWKQYLRFPKRLPNTKEPVNLSSEAIDLMQQLLCEPEDRLGSQASSSVSRPNSLIVQSRLSFVPQHSAADGSHLIKVRHFRSHRPRHIQFSCCRHIHGLEELIGQTSIATRLPIAQNCKIPRIRGILTTTYRLKYGAHYPHTL